MKLIVAIINQDDAKRVASALSEGGFTSTRVDSRGGYLARKNVTFFIGTAEEEVNRAKQIIRSHVHRREKVLKAAKQEYPGFAAPEKECVVVGGATIFVLDAEQFERI